MFRSVALVALALIVVGCGGIGGSGLVVDVNGPLTMVPDPPIVRAGTSTKFIAYGEGYSPNDFEWRTGVASERMTPNGVYTPGDGLGSEMVIGSFADGGIHRIAKTIPRSVAIVFASDASGQSEVWTINEDGAGLTKWTADGGSDPVGSTSGDRFFYRKGQQIWTLGFYSGTPLGGLYRDASTEIQPLEIADKWSGSDSGTQPFIVYRHSPLGGPTEYQVATVGPGGVVFLLVSNVPIDSIDNGNHRTVVAMGPEGSRQLFLGPPVSLMAGTDEPQQITFGTLDCVDPENGLDGRTIYFAGHDGAQWDIYEVDQITGSVRNLTNTPSINEEHPSLSPEGKRLVYSRGAAGTREIWTMNSSGKDRRRLVGAHGDCTHPEYLTLSLP